LFVERIISLMKQWLLYSFPSVTTNYIRMKSAWVHEGL